MLNLAGTTWATDKLVSGPLRLHRPIGSGAILRIELAGSVPQGLFDSDSLPNSLEKVRGRYLVTELLPYNQKKSLATRVYSCDEDGGNPEIHYESDMWSYCFASPDGTRFMVVSSDVASLLEGRRELAHSSPLNRMTLFDRSGKILSRYESVESRPFSMAGDWLDDKRFAVVDSSTDSVRVFTETGELGSWAYCESMPVSAKRSAHGLLSVSRAKNGVHKFPTKDVFNSVYRFDGERNRKLFATYFADIGNMNVVSIDELGKHVVVVTSHGIALYEPTGKLDGFVAHTELSAHFGTNDRGICSLRKNRDGGGLLALSRGVSGTFLYTLDILAD